MWTAMKILQSGSIFKKHIFFQIQLSLSSKVREVLNEAVLVFQGNRNEFRLILFESLFKMSLFLKNLLKP